MKDFERIVHDHARRPTVCPTVENDPKLKLALVSSQSIQSGNSHVHN